MTRRFLITDVFAEGPYTGNQLATLPDAGDLSSNEMQKIARAFNFAETTFITGGSVEQGYDVRIFTPATELPFAGHPTLGTSYLIRNHLEPSGATRIVLNLGAGAIPVTFGDDGVLWMRQNEPVFGDSLDTDLVARELDLDPGDVDPDFPCQRVSTGLEFLLVPLRSYEALRRAHPARGNLTEGCLLFCRGGYTLEQSIRARMFAPSLGVTEDPATGSANGCLAAYMAAYDYLDTGGIVDVRVGQGYEIDRPSQLYLRSAKSPTGFDVRVGGRVNLVAEGEWLL